METLEHWEANGEVTLATIDEPGGLASERRQRYTLACMRRRLKSRHASTMKRPRTAPARRSGGVGWLGVRPLLIALPMLAGCATSTGVPEPTPVVEAYAAALERGDAAAPYAMLSEESRRASSREELASVLTSQRPELTEHATALASADRVVDARAEVRFGDGEIVALDLDEGSFRVTAADALPAAAKTPEQALGQLRQVLARRSYAGLLRVLSPKTRAAVEHDLRSLVEGLAEPDALDVDVVGDTATVTVPGGHRVELRREDGVWYVDDMK